MGINMDADRLEYVKAFFGIDPILRTSNPVHPHALLAVARLLAERRAAKLAREVAKAFPGFTIHSLAPNTARECVLYGPDYQDLVWNSIPLVLPHDGSRQEHARRASLRNWCSHTAGRCHCSRSCVGVSTHVAYYLTPEEWYYHLSGLATRTHFAVLNRHDGVFGTRPFGESEWAVRQDGLIYEFVEGNTSPYVHQHTAHLFREGGFRTSDATRVVTTILETWGETVLMKLELVPCGPPEPARPLSLGAIFGDPAEDVPTDTFMAVHEDYVAAQLKIRKFSVLGDAVVLDSGLTQLSAIVSRHAVSHVATKLLGKVRNQATHQDALYYARQFYTRRVRTGQAFPEASLSSMVLATALIAQCEGIAAEMSALKTVQEAYGSLIKVYNRVVQWDRVGVVRWTAIACVTLFCTLISLALIVAVPEFHHAIGLSALAATACIPTAVLCVVCIRNGHRSAEGRAWLGRARLGELTAVSGPLPLLEPLLPGHRLLPTTTPSEIRSDAGSSLTVDEDPHPRAHPSDPAQRSEVVGMQVTDSLPLVIEPTQEAEIAGLQTRVLRIVPEISESGLKSLVHTLESHPALEPSRWVRISAPRDVKEKWLSRGITQGERANMERAFASLKAEAIGSADYEKNAFVKLEKTLGTVTREAGAAPKKPRIIQALSDRLKAYLSPALWWLGKRVREAYDGRSGALFASGRSTEQIGAYIQRAWDQCKDPALYKNDFSTYDASCGAGFRAVLACQMRWAGVDKELIAVWLRSRPTGRTTHGVSYKTRDGLCSGSPETSWGGSLYNVVATVTAFTATATPMTACVVMGDDGGGCIDAPPGSEAELEEQLRGNFEDLGLIAEPRLVRDPWEWEFASHVLFPVKAGEGRPAWKLSPMPGRVLAKMGTKRTDTRVSNLAADVASVRADAAHVPFLRVVLQRYSELLKGVAPRGRPDDYEYKAHAAAPSELHPEAWTWTTGRYGLDEADERELALYLATVKRLPSVVSHRVIDRLVERDTA